MDQTVTISREEVLALKATCFAAETMLHMNPRIEMKTRVSYLDQVAKVRNWLHTSCKEPPEPPAAG